MQHDAINKALITILFISILTTAALYYKNAYDPSPDATLAIRSDTEYYQGDAGKVIVTVVNGKGEPITASCNVTITYPNGSVYIDNQAAMQTMLGSYEYDFTTPDIIGVYEYATNCTAGGKTYHDGKSFHVSNATTKILDAMNTSTEIVLAAIRDVNMTLQDFNQTQHLILNTTQSINLSLAEFRDESAQGFNDVLGAIGNLTTNFSVNVTIPIDNLTSIILSFQNATGANFTRVIDLILAANASLHTDIDYTQQLILAANQSIIARIDALEGALAVEHASTDAFLTNMNLTLSTKLDAILAQLNISVNDTNIYVTANDCWQGGSWLITAQVTNQYGVPYSMPPMTCIVTTQFWGNATMSYNGALRLFQYTHVCDSGPTIMWSVACNK